MIRLVALLAALTAMAPTQAAEDAAWESLGERIRQDFQREIGLIAEGDPLALAALREQRETWIAEREKAILSDLRQASGAMDRSSVLLLLVAVDPAKWLEQLAAPDLLATSRTWDPSGRLAVPVADWLLGNGRARSSRVWLQRRAVPRTDRPFRDLILIESCDALGDSSAAGNVALQLANSQPRHELWADLALRGSLHLLHLGQGGNAWQLLERRSEREGESIRTRWLGWRILTAEPQLGSTARRRELLQDLARDDLNPHQINVLSGVLEKWLKDGWIPPEGEATDLASLLLRGNRMSGWRRLLQAVGDSSRARASEIVGQAVGSWRRLGRTDEAKALADSFLASCSGPERERVLLERARIHRRLGDLKAMAADSWETWRVSRDPQHAGLALWELARETEDEKGSDAALPIFRALSGRPETQRWARQAALKVGVLMIELGRNDDAVAWWDTLGVNHGRNAEIDLPHLDLDPETLAASWYWRGRAEEEAGRLEDARSSWTEAVNLKSPSYYSWLSERALEASAEGQGSSGLWQHLEAEILSFPDTLRGWRSSSAHRGDAPALPDGWISTAGRCRVWMETKRNGWLRGEWRRAGWDTLRAGTRVLLHYACGEETRGLRAAMRLSDPQERLWHAHPAAFPGPLLREAHRHHLSPFLLWAIMRQESAMDPRAVSRAGAVGLLQIMPSTAAEVAEGWKIDPGPLTSPARNIALGAAHLRGILDEGLSVPEALAAYNAGPEPVARWRAKAHSPDLFVEKIGYGETRGYVRRVLRDYGIYGSLYGDTDSRTR